MVDDRSYKRHTQNYHKHQNVNRILKISVNIGWTGNAKVQNSTRCNKIKHPNHRTCCSKNTFNFPAHHNSFFNVFSNGQHHICFVSTNCILYSNCKCNILCIFITTIIRHSLKSFRYRKVSSIVIIRSFSAI